MLIFFILHIFFVYVFCLGVYLFYSFFHIQIKFIIWICDLYMLEFCFRFCKIIFVCKLMKLMLNF
jgi:hypothetical protein